MIRSAADITVRSGRPEDHSAFLELFVELGIDDVPYDADRFAAEMVPTTLIAERDGAAVGYAYYRPIGDLVHLIHVVSARTARRTGVGRALGREVASRARALGCTEMKLNVKPENTAAITLYESLGLRQIMTSHALRLPWAVIVALDPSATPFAADARPIEPADDARVEKATGIPAGLFADRRRHPGKVLLWIEKEPGRIAAGVLDPLFPGINPLRAPDRAHALSLFRAFRPHARAQDEWVNVLLEAQPDLAQALLDAGATLRLVITGMRGPLA